MINQENNKQTFLGEGSYGCVIQPGYSCNGDINKSKKKVTKITEINFSSLNELNISNIIKNIKINNKKIYHNHFVPITNKCNVKYNVLKNFEIDKCNNFLDNIYDYNFNNTLFTKQFFIFTLRYINGLKIKKYLLGKNFNDEYFSIPNSLSSLNNNSYNNYKIFFNNFISTYFYLLKSIILMQNNNIIHNDLYNRNILFEFKKNKPLIIDFGLSYNKKKFYKNIKNSTIDIKYIHSFFFDYREKHYDYNTEKRFISFIINNKSNYFTNKVTKTYQKNELTKNIINFFINDVIDTIKKKDCFNYVFENDELNYYKNSLEKFYYQFLDKKKYDTYFKIINKLLTNVFQFTDLYSLTLEYIEILFYFKFNNNYFDNKYSNSLLYLFIQIFKIIILPDSTKKINTNQVFIIFKFILEKIYDYKLNNIDNDNDNDNDNTNDYYDIIFQEFKDILQKNSIDINLFYNKNYSYFDFKKILLNNESFNDLKKINIKPHQFNY